MIWYKKSKLLLPIFLGLTVALVAYTNCSDKSFTVSNETLQRLLSENSSIYINGDEVYTNSSAVNLTIENNSAGEMYVTNTKDCSAGGQWEPYATSKAWTLAEANIRTKAYVKFREAGSSVESACTWDSIIHDNTAPTLAVVQAAPAITNVTTLNFQFSAVDNLSGIKAFNCKDEKGLPFASCQEMMSLSPLKEGPGSATIIAEDNAGNLSAPLIQTWLADFTAPKVFINSTPSPISNNTSGVFSFSGTDNFSSRLVFECKLDAGAYVACTSPYSFSLTQGAHNFEVRAKDEAGNISNVANYAWTIDLSAPTVRLVTFPNAFSNSTTAPFTFDGMDEGVAITRFDCKIDGGAFTSCTSPSTQSGLSNGSHTFQVRGYDSAGNMSSPASYTWVIDTQAPQVQITSNPAKETNQPTATFQFVATDIGTSIQLVECRLDSAAFQACNNLSVQYETLTQGNHTFQVRAKDLAGNTSPTVSYMWFVDLTPPVLSFIRTPANPTTDRLAVFEMRVTDNSTSPLLVECRLDGGAFASCTLNQALNITEDGTHNFSVRARDAAGNTSAVLAHTWLLDSTGPAINFTSIPEPNMGILDNPEIGFTVVDTHSTVSNVLCGFQGQTASCPVTHSVVYRDLTVGSYVYVVTAVDSLGNSSTNSVSFQVKNNLRQISQNINVTVNNKADILVVIDNSGSMNKEQQNMAQRFSTFIDQLDNLDWRVAIVTTDMAQNADKKDGRFLKFNNTALKSATDVYFIHSGMDKAAAKAAFAATIQRPASEGSGHEQGIAASLRAIRRSQDPATVLASAPNRAFFRSDAVLSTVVITDANETNNLGTQDQNRPQFWFDSIRALWPTKPFSFHSIIVKSGDSACLSVNGNESYGVSYEQLSNLTGGIIGSVCANDYGTQLASMGQSVANLRRTVNLNCVPLNQNKNGTLLDDILVTLQSGNTVPAVSVSGQTLTVANDFPTGTHRIDYWCY
jgi:hypothetical protein